MSHNQSLNSFGLPGDGYRDQPPGLQPTPVVAAAASPSIGGTILTKSEPGATVTQKGVDAVYKAFKDPLNLSSKTPVSLLQELCSKSLLAPPIYELVSTAGATHAPTFSYRCYLTNEFVAIGNGSGKKRAKHAAALAVLEKCRDEHMGKDERMSETLTKLIGMLATDLDESLADLSLKDHDEGHDATTKVKTEQEGGGGGVNEHELPTCENPKFELIRKECLKSVNPVGELIEIAQRKAMRPPEFEFGDGQGPPHNRQFNCVVKFEKLENIEGFGKSKKSAKRQAALMLLFKLKTTEGFEVKNGSVKKDSFNSTTTNAAASGSTTTNSGHASESKPSKRGMNGAGAINLYHQLRGSKNEAAAKLLAFNVGEKADLTELNQAFLDLLSKEERFKYSIKHNVIRDEYFVFLQFQTNPVIVHSSSAAQLDEAIQKAICNSLVHLIIMCSR